MPLRRPQRRNLLPVALVVSVMTAVAMPVVTSSPASARSLRPTWRHTSGAALVGDSLADESASTFSFSLGLEHTNTVAFTHGGTAPCDWFDEMATQVPQYVDTVVYSFSGNAITPCMWDNGDPGSSASIVARYRHDTIAMRDILPMRVKLVLVGQPAVVGNDTIDALNELYRDLALQLPNTTYTDAGHAVETTDGAWTAKLPCLPFEDPEHGCQDGEIAVRAPDHTHFCPTAAKASDGVVDRCAAWSSGAYRYGAAMAGAVG
jgi:hypothetical protein